MPTENVASGSDDGRVVRIGCGAGFAGDRIDPARDLAERGELDFLFLECLAERTLAQSHLARLANPTAGFSPRLEAYFEAVLPGCRKNGTRLLTNMGAANPMGAGQALAAMARRIGMVDLKVGVVEGDDVLACLDPEMRVETGERLADLPPPVGANAYLGADALIPALESGADVVISGRVADPSLVVAPLVHAFGWRIDDWSRLGAATLVGHLLECGCQVTGGYFADPGFKAVPGLADIGYPIAEIRGDGRAVITKLGDTGGCVTELTVKEQLLYEVHDPAGYVTPDVIADFSRVSIERVGPDRIEVGKADGRARPRDLKVTVGFDGGFLAEAEISYAGSGAAGRAQLAAEIVRERLARHHGFSGIIRVDLIGLSSLHATAGRAAGCDTPDVRLRMALRSVDRKDGEALVAEMEGMWIAGPAGGGGVRGRVTPSVTTRSLYLDRALVRPSVRELLA